MSHRSPALAALLVPLALAACGARVPDSGAGVAERLASGGSGRSGGGSAEALALPAATPGAALAFGQVATACGTPDSAMGPAIEAAAGYAIHDADPTATGPRTHYLTGFSDGCPRQVTAALAVMGDPVTHETFRYESTDAPFDATDTAYEQVKAQVCGVPSGTPCGGATDRLTADTAFVTLYPVFGGQDSIDLLLHAGEVVAVDTP